MDRGHKKKSNSKLVVNRELNPGYNPFQESQNQRNSWTISNGSIGNSTNTSSASHRQFNNSKIVYRQNPHKKCQKYNGHATRRFNQSNHTHFNRR